MKWKVKKSVLNGTIEIPASKSHTIRALLIASLAEGESVIKKPLLTGDGFSALNAAKAIGAKTQQKEDGLHVFGVGKNVNLAKSVNMENSGTGTNMFSAAAALGETPITFDGDDSLRTRPMESLLSALEKMGAKVEYHKKFGGPPFTVCGKISGAKIEIDGNNSQYLSALLLVAPLLKGKTQISLKTLFERPYVKMTLWWLDKMRINYSADFENLEFTVEGGQKYVPIKETIPGDFSSATFSAVGAVLTGGKIDIRNIDFSDPQGDKEIFRIIEKMGAKVEKTQNTATVSRSGDLHGLEIDLNAMPDAICALAVLATQAKEPTKIYNVAQARIKETDRISLMTRELGKMGAKIEEFPDAMTIYPSKLNAANVSGYGDHRAVMALTLAGMAASGETIIDTVQAADVTYPSFKDDFSAIGAKIEISGQSFA
ncbi:MAG: 3-phosphoshikimate 1-carboxyvinyltransferase [Chitinispirillales bacterium]|jgi:3-phosphoshikimate 1-carboxyvinyltransferase|nr:3-phosphoshikimate 1-carboxyvinyltransferase [Chitinispirillales bacterium]